MLEKNKMLVFFFAFYANYNYISIKQNLIDIILLA